MRWERLVWIFLFLRISLHYIYKKERNIFISRQVPDVQMSLSSTERLSSTSFSQKQVQATDASDDPLCPAEVLTFSPVLLLRAVRPHHAEGHEGLPADPRRPGVHQNLAGGQTDPGAPGLTSDPCRLLCVCADATFVLRETWRR